MSPLTEKLLVILDDWDHLAAVLADVQRQCTTKDATIAGLQQTIANQQQQLAKQASELASLKHQFAALQAQANAALMSASDPEDVKLKKRIDAVYAAMETHAAGGPAAAPQQAQAVPPPAAAPHVSLRPATPTTFNEACAAAPARAAPGNGARLAGIPGQPQRIPAAAAAAARPQAQPPVVLSVVKMPQAPAGGGAPATSAGATSRYSSSEEAS